MGFWGRVWNTVARRQKLPGELDDEMRFHLEERAREYEAEGMAPAEALRRAGLKFGGTAKLREETRDADIVVTLDAWLRDAGIAARGLGRRPGLVIAVAASLALGVGLNSAVFSVVDAVLLKPLPFPDSAEVLALRETIDGNRVGGNPARFREWREQATSLTALAGFYGEGLVMTGRGEPQRISVVRSFGQPLALLGTQPTIGRGFTAAEERGEGEPVVLLMHRFWMKRFGGDRAIVGQLLTINRKGFTVIGVLPPELDYPDDADAIAPADVGFQNAGRGGNWFGTVARLAPGATREGAAVQVATIAGRMAAAHPDTDRRLSARLEPLAEGITGAARQPLWLLMGVVAFVLLIACLNIASLLVARAAERSRETAIRASLGAGRLSLLRLFLLEGLWLALLGGILGVGVAYWGVAWLKQVLPPALPRLNAIELDGRVLLFTMAATLASGLFFGLLPALQATAGAHAALVREGRGTVNSRLRQRTRRFLVALQAALSLMLLVGAALAAQGFLEVRRTPLGFQPERRLAVSVPLSWETDPMVLRSFNARLLEEIGQVPGVRRVGLTDRLPLGGETQSGIVAVRGIETAEALQKSPVDQRTVSAGYFAAIGQALLRGRLFEDRKDGPREAVVNQAFVERYLAGAPGGALGKELVFGVQPAQSGAQPQYFSIVGVVADVRRSPADRVVDPAVYRSYLQGFWPLNEFVIESQGTPPEALARAVREVVRRIDPNLPVGAARTLEESIGEAMAPPRVQAVLFGCFALGALFLAAVGLYGLLASDVVQRTQEMGVRLALGATAGELVAMMVKQGAGITAAGLALGLVGAVLLGRLLGGAVPGIPDMNWVAPAGAAAVLLVAAITASLIPARRAARVDPAVALRRD